MKLRILTAVPLALGVWAVVWWAPLWLFLLVILAVVELSLAEYFALSRRAGLQVMPLAGYLGAAALCVAQALWPGRTPGLVLAVLALVVLGLLAAPLLRRGDLKEYFSAAASTLSGVLYLGFLLSWIIPVRFDPLYGGRRLLVFLLAVVWFGDIFAFLVGRYLGRHQLFPRISPRKTVEGALAGIVGSLLTAWGFAYWFGQTSGLKRVILLAGIVAVASQAGDWVESALKRAADTKDSGSLLPGHGGMLDRIDSLVFGAPALWLAVTLAGLWK
jgi:phosphatidate cytidylyltransferase